MQVFKMSYFPPVVLIVTRMPKKDTFLKTFPDGSKLNKNEFYLSVSLQRINQKIIKVLLFHGLT